MKATIELIDSLRDSDFVKKAPHGEKTFKDNDMVFHEKDMQNLLSHHNRPL